jgi:hypothetical protein
LYLPHSPRTKLMFKKNVVLILGAGASHECGMPLGAELKESVRNIIRFRFEPYNHDPIKGDRELWQLLRSQFGLERANKYSQAGNELAEIISTFVSIDEALNYFSAKEEALELGKIAITYAILNAEMRSKLRLGKDGKNDISSLDDSWYREFFDMTLASMKLDDVETAFQNITIVNFNYDRTFEYYIYLALQKRAAVSADAAKKIVSNLTIIRPYGSAAPVNLDSGLMTNHHALYDLSKRIRTYTEQVDTTMPERIGAALDACDLILVLGFGFHQQNMILMEHAASKRVRKRRPTFATVKGIDEGNYDNLEREVREKFASGQVILRPCTSH